ncbi:MAG TPA: pyridoxal-phosphate dependent enzyme [Longimicrobiales bacterium]|nr:pyridoxal-phosphate dependent enzyme [Longimicrobiales bacterium]
MSGVPVLRDVSIQDILQARERIRGTVRDTPLQHSPWLSERAGCPVFLKLECWQRTGSFKLRGASNAVALLDADARARGLVTASAGNHGQGLALAAAGAGIQADIFVPDSAPETKKARIRGYGARLHVVPGIYDQAAEAALAFAEESGGYHLHPFGDPGVVAGQGTVGVEIAEALPGVRTVLVPVGGGGLISGAGLALKTLTAGAVRVIGVQSDATPAMHAAFAAGRVVPAPMADTLADGLSGATETASYERARLVTDDMILVGERGLAPAIRDLYVHDGVVAEGSGAVGVAALRDGAVSLDGPAVVIISGGNIDAATLARILSG